jgi:hypothetical protein
MKKTKKNKILAVLKDGEVREEETEDKEEGEEDELIDIKYL